MALHGLDSLRQALDDIDIPVNRELRVIYMQGLNNVGWAPIDQGRAAGNWFLKENRPSTETTTSTNGGNDLDKMPQWVLGKHLYYANNMPYINKLEYGGYGDGPKTLQGYSDQAVGGWVRKELLIMRAAIRAI